MKEILAPVSVPHRVICKVATFLCLLDDLSSLNCLELAFEE